VSRRAPPKILALAAFALLAACASRPSSPTAPPMDGAGGAGGPIGFCARAHSPAVPHALIGPDATIRVACGQPNQAAVASVSVEGSGLVAWSIALAGDPAFTGDGTFDTCAGIGPTVAFVTFLPPANAVPGDTFDTVVTVTAADGSFAPGTVKVHAEVVVPSVTVDKSSIDFGDVLAGATVQDTLLFRLEQTGVSLTPPADESPFAFAIDGIGARVPNSMPWRIIAVAAAPGDYDFASEWSAAEVMTAWPVPASCRWRTTIPLHMHVVGPDAGVDGIGTDGSP
jgi:hypothetical protein